MQIVTESAPVTEARKPSAARRSAAPRAQAGSGAMAQVRSAWQTLLGPAPLPASLLEQLLQLSNLRKGSPGQQVLSRLEVMGSLVLLVQGDVGLGLLAPPALLRIERSLRGPAWLDLSSAWLSCRPLLDAVALTEAWLVDIPRSAYEALLQRQPELARRTLMSLAQQVHTSLALTHDLMHKDAQARFAAWLLQRCDPRSAAPRVMLRERKRDIASQLGVTPETLSRLLKQFSGAAWLAVHGYQITLLDVPGLQACAEGGGARHST